MDPILSVGKLLVMLPVATVFEAKPTSGQRYYICVRGPSIQSSRFGDKDVSLPTLEKLRKRHIQ